MLSERLTSIFLQRLNHVLMHLKSIHALFLNLHFKDGQVWESAVGTLEMNPIWYLCAAERSWQTWSRLESTFSSFTMKTTKVYCIIQLQLCKSEDESFELNVFISPSWRRLHQCSHTLECCHFYMPFLSCITLQNIQYFFNNVGNSSLSHFLHDRRVQSTRQRLLEM